MESRERVKRRGLRLATTVLSPVLFFLCFELALRVLGFGGDYPLFVAATEMPGHLRTNDQVLRRYFPTRAPKVSPDVIYFPQAKRSDAYRIVVQGGSTAAGFPYGRWAGLAGMLGDRLEATFPDREIEVISTAMAAVNSYTLLDLADEIVDVEPDAVLIYAGHNEYLGVLGVGSALTGARSRSATLLYLRLRKLRVHQFLQRLIATGRSWLAPGTLGAAGDTDTLMARAADSTEIPFESEMYRQGLLQLEANLGLVLEKYRRAGIGVYIGTLVSNEGDQAPFASVSSDRVDRVQREELWRTHRDAVREGGDPGPARAALSQLLALDDGAADVWYALGRLEQEAGAAIAARDAFRNAKDRDRLRFRAPEDFNRIIRRLAERYDATLVPVQQHLATASPLGILGDELMLEHLHPNALGYFLLADAYYEALRQASEIGDWSGAPSRAEAERDMPITAIDRILANYAVRELKADFPFRETRQEVAFPTPRSDIERLAAQRHRDEIPWLDAMESLLQLHRKAQRHEEAVVVARMAAQAYPNESAPNYSAGMLLMQLEQFARARRYLERSLLAEPSDVATLSALVRVNRALDDEARAHEHLVQLKRVAPSHPLVRRPG